jgi:hypothetical protein
MLLVWAGQIGYEFAWSVDPLLYRDEVQLMPGVTKRSVYWKEIRSFDDLGTRVPRHLRLNAEDWAVLERKLGAKVELHQRKSIEHLAVVVKAQHELSQKSVPLSELLKHIKSLRRAALKYGQHIWQISEPEALDGLPLAVVEDRYFRRRSRLATQKRSPLELLGLAIDGLVATSLSVEKKMRESDQTIRDYDWVILLGAKLRDLFSHIGLPHTVRKDEGNKMKPSGNLPFIDFYMELLVRIGLAQTRSRSALATAISRHRRANARFSALARVNSHSTDR